MDDADFGRDHQVADVVFDIADRHRSDRPLQAHPASRVKIPLSPRDVRILALVRDQVVHQNDSHRLNARSDHFKDAVTIAPRFAFFNHRVLRIPLPQAYSNFKARSKTSDGAIRVMQRWSIGQSRSMQRAHSTPSARINSARGPSGAVSNSLVGPKIVSAGRPSAAAMCAGPVSLLMSISQAPSAPINSPMPVSPARLTAPRRFIP